MQQVNIGQRTANKRIRISEQSLNENYILTIHHEFNRKMFEAVKHREKIFSINRDESAENEKLFHAFLRAGGAEKFSEESRLVEEKRSKNFKNLIR